MKLAQILMFKTVAEAGSIVRAAELLHCVPSNITARIKSLEQELGTPLFHKDGRGLRLSAAGGIFLNYAIKINELVAEAKRAIAPSATPAGPLKIGAIESSATGRLPQLLAKYHERFPLVSLQISTGTWSQLMDDVLRHKLDGAVIAVKVDSPSLETAVIYEESLVLVASKSMKPLHSVADIQDKTIFMWPEGCPYRAALEQWLDKHEQSHPIVSYASYGTIVGCVSAGAGVSLVPKGIFRQYGQTANLAGYEFPDLNAIKNWFVWHKNTQWHPALDAFIGMLGEVFEIPSHIDEPM